MNDIAVVEADGVDDKADDEMDEEAAVQENNSSVGPNDDETFFCRVDASKWFLELKSMLGEGKSVDEISLSALRMMEFLQLGKIEKGSPSMDWKYKSLLLVGLASGRKHD